MKSRILIVSTVSRQFHLFEIGNIEVLLDLGYEVHCAANFSDYNGKLDNLNITKHHFDIQRSPFSLKNIKAYKQLVKIMSENKFSIVHCHSPMGGVIGRLAAKSSNITEVIYTAHGFHFYKGAPLINWIFYFNIEKYLSKFTKTIITINNEDYKLATKLKAPHVVQIPGIGLDMSKFDKGKYSGLLKRNELGINETDIVILSIGELIKRKNLFTAIKSLSLIHKQNYKYIICGKGKLDKKLKKETERLKLSNNVLFLGYRNDIPEICSASDIFVFPSFQEGLPVSVMEAMSFGLPIVASNIRGNNDLITNGKGGFLHKPKDYKSFANSLQILMKDSNLRKTMSFENLKNIKKYSRENVKSIMYSLYSSFLDKNS